MRTLLFSFLFISIVGFFSCKKDPPITLYSDFPAPIDRIFANNCATSGCHNDASYMAAAELNLSSFQKLFQGSSNGSPIIPFRSDFSSLCYFVNTYPDLGIINKPSMPINAASLSREDVIAVRTWINNGAPDKNGNIMWQENTARKKQYVLNQGCDVVTVIDAQTQLPMRYITVGKLPNTPELPHMVKVSPDGQYWYVVFVNANIIQKFRASDDVLVGEVDLGKDGNSQPFNNWNTVTISDDGKKAYCVSWQGNSRVASVDLVNMKLIQNIGGTIQAHGSALNKTNDTLYVTSQLGNYIYKIDTGFTYFGQVTLDGSAIPNNNANTLDPHEIIFSDDGSKYFVTCQASNQVRVMNTATDILLQVINTGTYPSEFAKNSAQQKLYVTCENQLNPNNSKQIGCVSVIDMNLYSVTNYPVGFQPHGLALDETNNYLIVASRNIFSNGPAPHHTSNCGRNGFVNYFKLSTMQLLDKQTEVASDPYSIGMRN